MSIRLRLAVVFAVASAVLIALGGWLSVDQLRPRCRARWTPSAVQLTQAARFVPTSDVPPGTNGPAPGEYVVQVVDGSGQLRGGSADAGSSPPRCR